MRVGVEGRGRGRGRGEGHLVRQCARHPTKARRGDRCLAEWVACCRVEARRHEHHLHGVRGRGRGKG